MPSPVGAGMVVVVGGSVVAVGEAVVGVGAVVELPVVSEVEQAATNNVSVSSAEIVLAR